MTERLYYRDSHLREFDALVLSCEEDAGRWRVKLDRTAFYPSSGGQPHDTGKLGGVSVLEVADEDDHTVIHYLSAAIPVGPIHGEVDWPRRIDHMQQHTGQHMLSAAFLELFHFPTVSFHLGRETSTIDLDAPSIVARHVEEAERRTNEIIMQDREVRIRYGTAGELAEAGIRKRVDREGVLRAIEIEGIDRQPCGGTHLARTGEAGSLLIRKVERRRETWRLEFVCGLRSLAAARSDFAALTQAASLLSCGLPAVPAAIEKTIEERRAQHAASKRLEERLAEHEARALLAAKPQTSRTGMRLIAAILEEATPAYLVKLSKMLMSEAGIVALLASRSSGHVVFAHSKDPTGGFSGDMSSLLRETLKEFDGKGGGSEGFAQGNLANASMADKAIARARVLAGFCGG
jgi:alanyl-tRNA synthetase